MKIAAVSNTLFRSQAKQTQDTQQVNPFVYTTSSENKKEFKPNCFKVTLGLLGVLAVWYTLRKLSGKKIFSKGFKL